MRLARFTLGVLGIILIIGTFSSFLPLLFLGGIATGSIVFAFGFPIFLLILGSCMVYFGFYFLESKTKTNNKTNGNDHLLNIVKWGIIYTIAILISNFISSRLMVVDTLLVTLITASMVSIIVQIIRSHDSDFHIRWFIFYFLLYANIIWAFSEFVLPKIFFQTSFFSSIVIGFILAGIVTIIQKINMNRDSIKWFSISLVIILLVANLSSMVFSPITSFLEPAKSSDITPLGPAKSSDITPLGSVESSDITPLGSVESSNSLELSEDRQICPSVLKSPLAQLGGSFDLGKIRPILNKLINISVWRIDENIRACYKGKYRGQYPDWIYCDDMIVSRWEKHTSGTIEYRWYTAVSAVWKPDTSQPSLYVFDNFYCENGKKVTVDKEKISYYVHVSRDGTEIKVEY